MLMIAISPQDWFNRSIIESWTIVTKLCQNIIGKSREVTEFLVLILIAVSNCRALLATLKT